MRAAALALAAWAALATGCGGPARQALPENRRGFTVGGSSGGGAFLGNCDPCDGIGAAGGFYVGYMLGRRLSLGVDSWSVTALFGETPFKDRIYLNYTLLAPSLRYWPRPRVFIEGALGLGSGSVNIETSEVARVYGAAASITVGRELWHIWRFVFDLQVRTSINTNLDVFAQAFGVSLGVAWY